MAVRARREEGSQKMITNGYGLSLWDKKSVLELDTDEGSVTCEYTYDY